MSLFSSFLLFEHPSFSKSSSWTPSSSGPLSPPCAHPSVSPSDLTCRCVCVISGQGPAWSLAGLRACSELDRHGSHPAQVPYLWIFPQPAFNTSPRSHSHCRPPRRPPLLHSHSLGSCLHFNCVSISHQQGTLENRLCVFSPLSTPSLLPQHLEWIECCLTHV